MNNSDFPQGAALVFGGSGGIGQHVARSFAAAGSDVAVAYRSKREAAEKVAAGIRELGRKASIHGADVADAAAVRAAVAEAVKTHGRIHTVAFAAGPVVEQVYIADTTPELWKRSMDIEANGFFNVVQATLPHLREKGGGSYVHMGSAGHVWWPAKDGLSVATTSAPTRCWSVSSRPACSSNCSSAACSTRNGSTRHRSCWRSSAGASRRKSATPRCFSPPAAAPTSPGSRSTCPADLAFEHSPIPSGEADTPQACG
jgi:NAD(P)-dependent dehydrogenase (short-subunit alcohol dehydrogenase family)